MARSPDRSNPSGPRGAAIRPLRARVGSGFTLLELLLVVTILVIVAGGAVVMFTDAEQRAATGVAQRELIALRDAVLRFRHDTGHLPKRGPFALVADGGLIDPADDAHWPPEAPAGAADRAAWFASPANLYQLYANPGRYATYADFPLHVVLKTIAGPDGPYNVETARGYRGPYLSRSGEGFVVVGDDLAPDGSGDPAQGSALAPVPAAADSFGLAPQGTLFLWTQSPLAPPDSAAPSIPGRPYLLFVLPETPGRLGPRIVCLGPNGAYDSTEAALNPSADGDDLGVFLLE